MDHNITIIYEKGEQGWWVASIPEVPGAISQGKTIEEAKEMVLDALKELLIARHDLATQGLDPSTKVESISMRLAS